MDSIKINLGVKNGGQDPPASKDTFYIRKEPISKKNRKNYASLHFKPHKMDSSVIITDTKKIFEIFIGNCCFQSTER